MWRSGNVQLAANGADGAGFDFAMPGHGSDFAVRRIEPNGVVASLAAQLATVLTQMPLEIV